MTSQLCELPHSTVLQVLLHSSYDLCHSHPHNMRLKIPRLDRYSSIVASEKDSSARTSPLERKYRRDYRLTLVLHGLLVLIHVALLVLYWGHVLDNYAIESGTATNNVTFAIVQGSQVISTVSTRIRSLCEHIEHAPISIAFYCPSRFPYSSSSISTYFMADATSISIA